MLKKRLAGLLCLTALSLCACGGKKALSNPTPRPTYTLPTIQTEISPAAQLTQAIGKSVATGSFALRYGTIFGDVQTVTEQQVIRGQDSYTSLVCGPEETRFYDGNRLYILSGDQIREETADRPYTRQEIFQDIYAFLPNPELIRAFTSHRLTVTPGANGALEYVCGYLDEEELGQILYGGQLPGDFLPTGFAKAEGKVTFRVDGDGQFTGLRADIELYQSGSKPDAVFTVFVDMEQIGTLESIPVPDWIPTDE